jgi:quinol monooxygenase YgiN
MLARSVLYMQPREGCREELINTWERLGVPERAIQQDGCLSVELQVPAEESAPVLITALWSDRSAYDGWLSNPWRAESTSELEPLLAEDPSGVVYDVRIAAGQSGTAAGGRG